MRSAKLLFAPIMLAIAVQVTFAEKHDDSPAQITARIQDKLYHAQVFKHGDVQVSVENGVATLTGTVDCLGVKMDAEHATRKVDDVTERRRQHQRSCRRRDPSSDRRAGTERYRDVLRVYDFRQHYVGGPG